MPEQKCVILFDVDGVLISGYHAKPELQTHWDADIEADLGLDRAHFKENFVFGVFVKEVIVGKKDFKTALTEYLSAINSHVEPQYLLDYWLEKDANINHDLLAKVKLLKRSGKARLFIATNQEHNRARYIMETLGFDAYFDDIFHSARIGSRKPENAYFERVATHLGTTPTPPIFFDDTQAVIDAANSFGWQAHQYDTVADLHKSEFVRRLLEDGGK